MARIAKKKILMNEKHIIRIAIADSDNTVRSAAKSVGIKDVTLYNHLHGGGTMTLTSLYSILDGLGYEIIIRKKGYEKQDYEYPLSELNDELDLEWKKKVAIAQANEKMREIEAKNK